LREHLAPSQRYLSPSRERLHLLRERPAACASASSLRVSLSILASPSPYVTPGRLAAAEPPPIAVSIHGQSLGAPPASATRRQWREYCPAAWPGSTMTCQNRRTIACMTRYHIPC